MTTVDAEINHLNLVNDTSFLETLQKANKTLLHETLNTFVMSGHGRIDLDRFLCIPSNVFVIALTNEGRIFFDADIQNPQHDEISYAANFVHLWIKYCSYIRRSQRTAPLSGRILKSNLQIFRDMISQFLRNYPSQYEHFLNVYSENDMMPDMRFLDIRCEKDIPENRSENRQKYRETGVCPSYLQARGLHTWNHFIDKTLHKRSPRTHALPNNPHASFVQTLYSGDHSPLNFGTLLDKVMAHRKETGWSGVTTIFVSTCMRNASKFFVMDPEKDTLFKNVLHEHALKITQSQRERKRKQNNLDLETSSSMEQRLIDCVLEREKQFQECLSLIKGDPDIDVHFSGFEYSALFYKKFWFGPRHEDCENYLGADFLLQYKDTNDTQLVQVDEDGFATFWNIDIVVRNVKGEKIFFGFERQPQLLRIPLHNHMSLVRMLQHPSPSFFLPDNPNGRQLMSLFVENEARLNISGLVKKGLFHPDTATREKIFEEWSRLMTEYMGPQTAPFFLLVMRKSFVDALPWRDIYEKDPVDGKVYSANPINQFVLNLKQHRLFQGYDTIVSSGGLVRTDIWQAYYSQASLVRNKSFPYSCPLEFCVANYFQTKDGTTSLLDLCRQRWPRDPHTDYDSAEYLSKIISGPLQDIQSTLIHLVQSARKEILGGPNNLFSDFQNTKKLADLPVDFLLHSPTLRQQDLSFFSHHLLEKFDGADYTALKKEFSICNTPMLFEAFEKLFVPLSTLSNQIDIQDYYDDGIPVTVKYILDMAFYKKFYDEDLDPASFADKAPLLHVKSFTFQYLILLQRCVFEN